jgi:Transposase DDE domain group 1
VLIRTDSGGGTHDFLAWLSSPGRRLHYSVGMTITEDMHQAILTLPDRVWEPAYHAGGQVRRGAWAAGLTGLLDLSSWPPGMRVIVGKERPHPGAQLRFTDIGGRRVTCFATSTKTGQLAGLELRHRRRARCEDRIRAAKDTGLRNLPLHGFAQNQIWCELVAMACELTAWMQLPALDGPARSWEPNACGCSPPPDASCAAAAACGCASPRPGPGPPSSPPRSPGCRPSPPAEQPKPPRPPGTETRGPVEPRPPGATAGPLATAGH